MAPIPGNAGVPKESGNFFTYIKPGAGERHPENYGTINAIIQVEVA
jgi:hypothetical protein